jgi:23S rRNA (adenine2503-C2)-methyltransferase
MDHQGGNIGPRMITVSTAGHVPGLMRFNELGGVNLALSLHSPFDEERSQLIPINKKWPIAEVFSVLDTIPRRRRQYINCEYLLIKGLNHSERHADALLKLLGERPAMVNIIPFNPFPGTNWQRPSEAEIETFMQQLVARKLRVFRRTTKGEEIMAACGQLNTGLRA